MTRKAKMVWVYDDQKHKWELGTCKNTHQPVEIVDGSHIDTLLRELYHDFCRHCAVHHSRCANFEALKGELTKSFVRDPKGTIRQLAGQRLVCEKSR